MRINACKCSVIRSSVQNIFGQRKNRKNIVPLFHGLLAGQAVRILFLSRLFALEVDKGNNVEKGYAYRHIK